MSKQKAKKRTRILEAKNLAGLETLINNWRDEVGDKITDDEVRQVAARDTDGYYAVIEYRVSAPADLVQKP